MIFQFGWAGVQISHLVLIPELSNNTSRRVSMNSYRNAFTVVANLTVFGVLYILMNTEEGKDPIGPQDLKFFRELGIGVVVGGLLVAGVFYTFVKEPFAAVRPRLSSFSSETTQIMQMSWQHWFTHRDFYLVALLFMFCRLYINTAQVYFPFYITLTRGFPKSYLAIFPMISYIFSFAISCLMGVSHVNRWFKRKVRLQRDSLMISILDSLH
jgi:Na+/melibiose symporter-like transporter